MQKNCTYYFIKGMNCTAMNIFYDFSCSFLTLKYHLFFFFFILFCTRGKSLNWIAVNIHHTRIFATSKIV